VSNQYNSELVAEMARACKPFCSEDNDRLYPLVVAGDANARQRMIEGNMSLAITKVESFIRCFPEIPHRRADQTRHAFLRLAKLHNNMDAGKRPRKRAPSAPVDFMGMWINRELGRLVEDETPIRVPHTSKDRARNEGQEMAPPAVVNDIPERCAVPSYQKDLEIRDLIEACCTSDAERRFIAMRRARNTLAAIADAFGVPTHTISNLQRKLKARIRERLGQTGQLSILPTKGKRGRSTRRSENKNARRHSRNRPDSRSPNGVTNKSLEQEAAPIITFNTGVTDGKA